VSPIRDTGGVPGPTDFYTVYAYIELDPAGWSALEKSAGPLSTGKIVIPEEAAAIVIPSSESGGFKASGRNRQAEGPSFNVALLSADPKTDVESAVRVGGALFVQMRVQ
jgi:hypothetical protein